MKKYLLGCLATLLMLSGLPSYGEAPEKLVRSAYQLLDNRFRLDHGIEEVTLVVYRKPGSGPIVLVQPDGSKLYAHSSPENVNWYDEDAFDLITITGPTPGPWQIVGSIDRRNAIEILSAVELQVTESPKVIYQHERLKLTAQLFNHGDLVNSEAFFRSTELDLFLIRRTLNQPNPALNPGADDRMGKFFDNGTGLDEYPRDGVYTGEVDIKQKPGRYKLYARVNNKTFQRAATQDIELKPIPVKGSIVRVKDNALRVEYVVDDGAIKLDTVAINLMVTGANEFQYPLTLVSPEQSTFAMELDFINRTGDYRIGGWLFADDQTGREVAIQIPMQRFSVIKDAPIIVHKEEAELIETPEMILPGDVITQEQAQQMAELGQPVAGQQQTESSGLAWWIWLVIGSVVFVLLLVAGWFIWKKRKKAANSGQENGDSDDDGDIDLNRPEDR